MTDLDPEEFRRQAHAVVDWIADYRAGLADRPVGPGGRARLGARAAARRAAGGAAAAGRAARRARPRGASRPARTGSIPASSATSRPTPRCTRCSGTCSPAGWARRACSGPPRPRPPRSSRCCWTGWPRRSGSGREFTFAGGGGGSIQDSASSASLVALLAALHRSSPAQLAGRRRRRPRARLPDRRDALVGGQGRAGGRPRRAGPARRRSLPRRRSTCRRTRWPPRWPPTSRPGCGRCWSARRWAARAPARSTGCASVAAVGREHGAWVHVDAAWAGVAALCPEHRELLDGVELADSFCTDAHKWLLTAFDASLLWVRDGRALPAALSITPEYLRNPASESGRGRRLPGLAGAARSPVPRAQAVGGDQRATGCPGCAPTSAPTSRWPPSWPSGCAPTRGSPWPVPPSLALVCLRVVTGARTGGRRRRHPDRAGRG